MEIFKEINKHFEPHFNKVDSLYDAEELKQIKATIIQVCSKTVLELCEEAIKNSFFSIAINDEGKRVYFTDSYQIVFYGKQCNVLNLGDLPLFGRHFSK
jgi:transcriptional antiterminator